MPHPLPSSTRSRCLVFALALAVAEVSAGAVAPPALAQTAGENAAAAQALFDEAMRLMKAGQTAEACPKLEESQRLDPGMATQFRLAECNEKVGKIASAWATYVAVADAAAVARLPDREAVARKRAEALGPRLARLTIAVPPAVATVAGVELLRDGVALGKPLWGVPVPVDPGQHVVVARAPGKNVWEGRVTAVEAGAFTVTIQPLEDLPPVSATPPPRRERSVVPAILLGGLAAAGVGAGAALFVVHSGRRSDAEALSAQIKGAHGSCGPASAFAAQCRTLADKASSSDTFGNVSTVAFAAGGAAAVAMVTYLLWPAAKPAPASAGAIRLSPAFGEGHRGLFATGSF